MATHVRDLDPDALAALEEERDFLLRSLDDLEREHDQGDVDDVDYVALKDDYTARAAATIRAVEDGKARFAEAGRPRSAGRSIGIAAAIVAVAVLTGVVMAQASGRRGASDLVTGDINSSIRTQVRDCIANEVGATDALEVVECYGGVLEVDPDNVSARTYLGWFLARTGFQAGDQGDVFIEDGLKHLDRAVETDPGFADARVFRAVVYNRQGDTAAALAELDVFDTLDAPDQAQQLADGLRSSLEAEDSGPTTTAPG